MESEKTIIGIRIIEDPLALQKKLEYLHKRLGVDGDVDLGPTQLRSGSFVDNATPEPIPLDELELGYINPIVLNNVFRFLDFSTLQDIRVVSRFWNDEASRVLTKKSCIYIRNYCPYRNKEGPNLRHVTHADLQDTIQASRNPHRFFVNLVVTSDWLTANEDEALGILDRFGKYLKAIKVLGMPKAKDVADIGTEAGQLTIGGVLSGICTILNKSPNLETLTFLSGRYHDMKEFRRANKHERQQYNGNVIPMSLNLTTLEIETDISESLADFCISLIKVSPKFCKLRIGDDLKRRHRYRGTLESISYIRSLEKLAKHPEIIKPLEEFSWKALIIYHRDNDPIEQVSFYHDLELISKLEFSPKLKTLRLGRSKDTQNNKSGSNLIQILKKISGSLEILDLSGRYLMTSGDNQIIPLNFSSIPTEKVPMMMKLKVLKIDSENAYGFGNVSVLMRFPKLHTFFLEMKQDGYNEAARDHSIPGIDGFFRNWESLQNCPHMHLKRLFLAKENVIDDPNTLNAIIGSFPNLECLYMGIKGRAAITCNLSVEDALEMISIMQNLKELSVYDNGNSSMAEIRSALVYLKDFKKLENFVLSHGIAKEIPPTKSFRNWVEDIQSSRNFRINITIKAYKISPKNNFSVMKFT